MASTSASVSARPIFPPISGKQFVQEFGITGLAPDLPDVPGILNVNFAGLALTGISQGNFRNPGATNHIQNVQDHVSLFRGKHNIKIGFNQVTLEIMPAWGGAERLVELVGYSKALLLAGTGTVLDAAAAERIGLVDKVFPRASFDDDWRAIARALASRPAGEIKRACRTGRQWPSRYPRLRSGSPRQSTDGTRPPGHLPR